MKEYKIGDIVDIDGIKYILKEEIEKGCCTGCVFLDDNANCTLRIANDENNMCNTLDCIFVEYKEDDVKEKPLDLTKILDGCPVGTKFYSVLYGEVNFVKIANGAVYFTHAGGCTFPVCHNGLYVYNYQGECIIFPSKDQRDWSRFVRFWDKPKKDRFDPKTLQPFDKVIVRLEDQTFWSIDFFSFVETKNVKCIGGYFNRCVPYNDVTKHLVGTTENAPEYYRYWED